MRWCETSAAEISGPNQTAWHRVRPGRRSLRAGARYSTCCANRFYIGEVKYKDEILARRAAGDHGSRSIRCGPAKAYGASGALNPGHGTQALTLLRDCGSTIPVIVFGGIGMVCRSALRPHHGAKGHVAVWGPDPCDQAGVRYRYYVSLPLLHGESKQQLSDRFPAFRLLDI